MIEKLYKPIEGDLHFLKEHFGTTLNQFTPYDALKDVLNYSTQSTGKWVRACLCLYGYYINQSNKSHPISDVYQACYAIEAIQLASLIHDDMIDAAEFRREKPCLYKAFDTNTGIISGVFIYSIALQLISSINEMDLINSLSQAVSNLCQGEFEQMHQRFCFDMSQESYNEIIYMKTAALFESSCYIGARLAKSSKKACADFAYFGAQFGLLFQLLDDYHDLFSSTKQLKKLPIQDLITGDISKPILILHQLLDSKKWSQFLELAQNQKHDECIQLISPSQKQSLKDTLQKDIQIIRQQLFSSLSKQAPNPYQQSLQTFIESFIIF